MTQAWSDDDRIVELDDEPLLPEQTRDDTDAGWGDGPDAGVDERLLAERPPHWD
jgi:hypothetical protein